MHLAKKLRKKLNDRAWPRIFVRYKEKYLYKIYYPFTKKILKTWDVDINKNLLYDKSEFNIWEFTDKK